MKQSWLLLYSIYVDREKIPAIRFMIAYPTRSLTCFPMLMLEPRTSRRRKSKKEP